LARLNSLATGQPEWLQKVTAEQTANIQELLAQVQPLTQAQVLQQAEAQQTAWDEAQRLIDGSPFKGLKREQIPLNEEGKAYLAALETKRPARFDYQRLADGVELALPALQAAIRLQGEAEALAHRLDVKLNGDKAAPLGSAAKATLEQPGTAALPRPQSVPATSAATAPAINGATDSLGAAMREAEREAERQLRQAEREAQLQQQEAEAATRRAEQQAQRKQQEAQRAAERQRREAEAQAKAAAAAEERSRREAEREAERQRIAAQRAAEAKQRECTSSLMARAKCAAEGYNPLTGVKN